MIPYVIRRLLWLVPVLLFVSLITFAMMHAVEGGPWDPDVKVSPAAKENLARKYGLDEPLLQQYATYMGNALQGDLGISFFSQEPVTDLILRGFRVSASLGLLAMAIAATGGVALGMAAAVHRNGPVDHASVLLASVGSSVPSFALAIPLLYVFAVELRWLPTFGWGSWQQAVLPVVTLSALPLAYLARVTRASMLEVLTQDYIRTARSKGLGSVAVLYRHGLRNALLPIVTLAGPLMVALITGSFIIEQVFSIPGTGRLFVTAVLRRDYGVIMGTTLFFAVLIAVVNLAVDIWCAALDPRVREERA
jgi:oligopeptide transport system permease protein